MKTASGLVDAQTENPSAPGYFAMHEIDQEWVWFDGPGDPPPIPPDDLYGYTAILGATDHVLDPNLIDQIDDFWPGLRPRRR